MDNDAEEILKLKSLYDELWDDAKTLIRDMREGISMYRFSGLLVLVISIFAIFASLGGFQSIFVGNANLLDYFNAPFGAFSALVFIIFGRRLLRWHNKLKERYAGLLEMEKSLED